MKVIIKKDGTDDLFEICLRDVSQCIDSNNFVSIERSFLIKPVDDKRGSLFVDIKRILPMSNAFGQVYKISDPHSRNNFSCFEMNLDLPAYDDCGFFRIRSSFLFSGHSETGVGYGEPIFTTQGDLLAFSLGLSDDLIVGVPITPAVIEGFSFVSADQLESMGLIPRSKDTQSEFLSTVSDLADCPPTRFPPLELNHAGRPVESRPTLRDQKAV